MPKIYNHVITDKRINDPEAAVSFLTGIASSSYFEAHYYSLRDLHNSHDEGNTSVQFDPGVTSDRILEELGVRHIDRLFLMGSYKGVMTGIGIDLMNYLITVSVPENSKSIADEITGLIAHL